MKRLKFGLHGFLLPFIAAVVFLISLAGVVVASDISTALYSGIIRITNNSTATSNFTAVMTLDSQSQIDQGYVDTAFTRCAIRAEAGDDAPFMPSINSSVPWNIWVPSIGAYSSLDYTLYFGSGNLSATKYYFPGLTGMTVIDDNTMEGGDNFTYRISGLVDTDNNTNKYLINKYGSFNCRVSENVSGNITCDFNSPYFIDTFYTDIWTDVGSGIEVSTSNGRIDYDAIRGNGDDRTFYDTGTTFSNTFWTMPFIWHPTSDPIVDGNIFAIGAFSDNTNYDGNTGDAIFMRINGGAGGAVQLANLDGGALIAATSNITYSNGNTYYVVLARTSTTSATLSIYSDIGLTTHITGSPLSLTIPVTTTGLQYIQASNYAGAGFTGESTGWVDDIRADNLIVTPVSPVTITGVNTGDNVTIGNVPVATFNGTDYFRRAQANYRSTDAVGTICAWFKIADAAGQGSIFTTADEAGPGPGGTGFGITDAGLIFVNNYGAANGYVRGDTALNDDTWHLATLTCDGTAWALFSDNAHAEVLTPAAAGNTGTWFNEAASQNRDYACIGAYRYNAVGNLFEGSIGDVLIYSVNLTTSQISDVYFGNPPTTGLVGRFRLDEGSGTTAFDSISTWHLTAVGGANMTASKLSINVNDTSLAVGDGSDITDTNDNLYFLLNDTVPYSEYMEVSVNGTQVGYWDWEYAGTFTDSSGYGNTGYPSFNTISGDPDVSASLVTFEATEYATAPAYSVSDAPSFITASIEASSNFTSGNITTGGVPGAAVIDAAATASETPNIWIWGITGGLLIAMIGLVISYMERNYGSGRGTIFIRLVVAVIIFGILVTIDRFDFWMLIMYLFIALAPAIASMQLDWGGTVGQLNLIGFLAFTWITTTTINRIQEGQIITSAETAHLNTLMFTQEFTLLDVFHLPIINFRFFSQGLPSLLKWDLAVFGGNAQIIQYLLYSITAIVSLIVLGYVIGTVTNYFARSS